MAMPTTSLTPPSDTNDYSKIFSTNGSSTPFTWLDADYLKGWDVVGSVPPARTQFNALQRMTDEKLNALKAYTEFQKQYNAYLKSCSEYLDKVKAPINSPTFTGDPKAPTPAKNDNDTSIATTAFVRSWINDAIGEIKTKGDLDGGYVKFGNGFMIQWGVIYSLSANIAPNSYIDVPFSFPVSFPQKCLTIVGTDGFGYGLVLGFDTATLVGCTVRLWNFSDIDPAGYAVRYIALGC